MSIDFLTGVRPSDPGSINPTEQARLAMAMESIADNIADIRLFMYRQNPDVLAMFQLGDAGADAVSITDTVQHSGNFLIGGQSVTVYQTLIWSTYTSTVYVSHRQMATYKDGIPFASGDVLVLPNQIDNLYIWVPVLGASSALHINGNSDPTDGGMQIFGYTVNTYSPNRYSSQR